MSDTPQTSTQHEFRAEIRQLLHILVHSLYTEREIFLRELLANASDALNRLQFEMLTRGEEEILDAGAELAVRLSVDSEARTLTIADNGIGMTAEEMIENLGTIARSGAATFLRALEERPSHAREIIGQFGVGFYSVFMVAERVEVTSRSFAPEAEAVRWSSTGDERYEIGPAEKATRGTEIVVHLREEAAEFADEWRVRQIVKRHADYMAYPIYLGDEVINQRTALWRRSPREVTEEEYKAFYEQISFDHEAPLLTVHLSSEVPHDLHAILFVPSGRERSPLRMQDEAGLRLYSRKVLIQPRTTDLLPPYLRFVEGVVDSEDLPLNVSRETVQSNRVMAALKRALTERVLKEVKRLAEKEPERYAKLWEAFGPFLKEGIAAEPGAAADLAPLLRFPSSRDEGLTSLADYRGRMAEGQSAIYYVLADGLSAAARSPHLDPFRAREIEVLYLAEPIDSFVVGMLHEFEGTPLKSVDDPSIELPPLDEEAKEEEPSEAAGEAFEALAARAKALLGERVTAVRASQHLRDSAVRLVAPGGGMAGMERVRRLLRPDEPYEVPPREMELNRNHPLVRDLAALAQRAPDDPFLAASVEQLYENALLLEGLHPNPAEMVERIQQLLAWAAKERGA